MKLLKPHWVSHDGNPIFSVDLHPDGSRFATGGQGDGGSSGKVVVWNTSPVISAKVENDENVPKILCVMDNHLACVNCVRWSCNGRYLASGGDDRLIMIWQFAEYGGAVTFGSSQVQSVGLSGERWRCSHTLKRHTGDILHLAWSPTDQWLASCSIDNTVVVWNAQKFPEVTAVLRGHTSLVKGVTWDPVGTYLASQSDDKSVRVWKTLDWKLDSTITKPFKECGATTHVLRLDWSPDGGYLVSAHAMNNSGPTAQIIEREGWKTNMDFVGHRKAITCTRFNGRMFRRHPSKGSNRPRLPYTCCAVGSRDRSLSVWLTSLRRPLVVINDLFEDSVMDISWSFLGLSLLCCSWDGTVAYLEFKPQEIGEALTREEMNDLHKKTYGKSMCIASQPLVIENPAMLAIQQKKAGATPEKKNPAPPVTPIKYPTEQVEVRTPTGRRRIIPIFVAAQEELGGVPRPFGSGSAFGSSTNLSSNLSKSPSKLNRTSSLEKTLHKKSDSDRMDTSASSTSKLNASAASDKMISIVEKIQENDTADRVGAPQVTSTPKTNLEHKSDGILKEKNKLVEQKKVFLDNRLSEKTKTSPAVTEKATKLKSSAEKTSDLPKSKPDEKQDEKSANQQQATPKPSTVTPSQSKKPGKASATIPVKRKAIDGATPAYTSPKQPKRIRKEHVVQTPDAQKQHSAQQALFTRLLQSTTKHTDPLPAKKPRKIIAAQVQHDDKLLTYRIINDVSVLQNKLSGSASSALHKVACSDHLNVIKWETVLSSPGVAICASIQVVCVASSDKTFHVFSPQSGRKILPIICLQGAISEIKCNEWKVMVICSDATVSIWDTQSQKSLLRHQSFSHLLPSTPEPPSDRKKSLGQGDEGGSGNEEGNEPKDSSPLRQSALVDGGMPLLTFSNHSTYTFSPGLHVWILVNSAQGAIEQCANYKTPFNNDLLKNGVLSSLQKSVLGIGTGANRMFSANPSCQRSATLVMFEDRIESSVVLSSPSEYKYWILLYTRHLVEDGLDVRLREVCDNMLGPTHIKTEALKKSEPSNLTTWEPYVLGIFKRDFLRDDVLPLIGSNLNFQRLYTEYHDQIDVCDNVDSLLS